MIAYFLFKSSGKSSIIVGIKFYLFINQKQMSNENDKSPQKEEKKVFTYQDLIKFSNTQIYSAFGQVKDSTKPTAPKFSFGTSTRDAQPKKFVSKEMALVDCYGKQTPKGPNYIPTDKFSYIKDPSWKIGTQTRNTLDSKPKYEHYHRKDVDFDINEADKSRRLNPGNTRFGGDSRFPPGQKKYKMTPGPQYNPTLKPQIQNPPQYSLYARRAVKGFDPLILLNSTSQIVGPGAYHPQKSSNTSITQNKPTWSIPKGPRDRDPKNKWQLNQTYDTSSSIGGQFRSDKVSKPTFSMGKNKRDNTAGIFKSHMQFRPVQVRISHPNF